MRGDRTIYLMGSRGKMLRIADPLCSPEKANFVIVCEYGDWSGFRTLAECERQFPELEQYARERPERTYSVVER